MAFIIVATKPGNIVGQTISDLTADIILSLFLLCSVLGVIGGIKYESGLVAIPRFAYCLKAVLAGLTGIFVVNVAAEIPTPPIVIISLLGETQLL